MRYPGWITKFIQAKETEKKSEKDFELTFLRNLDVTKFPELPAYPDFLQLEDKVKLFWEKYSVMDKYLVMNDSAKEKFSFFDGPITANNPMGVHHAWGRTIKDTVLRYQTFLGKKLRYQNGFDCQGLWIEVEVEKSLKLNSKKDILDYGLDNFSKACQNRVDSFGSLITDQSQQLGQFMDWNHSYWTHTDQNIEHIWHFLGKCHENGWLYKGHRIMPWCTRCETSLSQHEQSDSYKELVHPSIFVQFQVEKYSKKLKTKLKNLKASFLVWTTTPWTLPANVAVAVNPDLRYAVVQDNTGSNTFVVGETAFEKLKFLRSYTKVGTVLGEDLVGTQLESLTKSFVPKQEEVHVQVVPAEFVSEVEGTGLVHIAPGCGLDDFELGKKLNLPFFAPLNDDGSFLEEFGFTGLSHLEVSKLVQKKLKELDLLVKQSSLKHRYPVCWRCGQELVFRLVDEWFIKTGEIRPQLLSAVETVTWHPYYMKDQMKNWLTNMGDWCISRKRFWGLPLPFFECSCGHVTVVDSLEKLYLKAGFANENDFRKVIPDLHRPYVDNLEITCEKCGNKVKRVLSVGDCWLDAGVVPFSTLNYLKNHDKGSLWDTWFPADFVVEMREQIRLWFYSMLFMSVTLTGKAPYTTVMAYEKVLDEHGEAMHRSKGNAIWWSETASKVGADANRLFYTSWDPTKALLYGYNNLRKSLNPFNTFWSCCRFFQQNVALSPNYWPHVSDPLTAIEFTSNLDKWLVLNLKKTHGKMHQYYQSYNIVAVRQEFDSFWTKVSTFWLRNSREKFWHYENNQENDSNLSVYQLLWHSTLISLFWLAPIAPHVSEYLYQLLIRPFTNTFKESIHLNLFYNPDFPVTTSFEEVDNEVSELETLLETGRNVRQLAKLKMRYSLPEMYVFNDNYEKLSLLEKNWKEVLLKEFNVKQIFFKQLDSQKENEIVTLSKSGYKVSLSLNYSDDLKVEWLQSEVIRTVQFLRKEANLSPTKKSYCEFNYEKSDFPHFLTESFLSRLETDAFVELVNNTSHKNKSRNNDDTWLSKNIKFESKEVIVRLKD